MKLIPSYTLVSFVSSDDLKEVVEYVRNQKAESETLVISEPKTERFNTAVQHFDYKKYPAIWEKKPSFGPSGPKHEWHESKEDSPVNRTAYMAYLRDSSNIVLPQGTQLFEGNSDKELLSVRFLGFGNVKISGNIDVVVASSIHQSIATIRQNILVGIELKKDTNQEHAKIERQVILQHLAASYLNPETGILTLMTDLDDRWHFFWFAELEGKRLMRYEATRSEAKFLIQHSLDSPGSEAEQISTPASFLNRSCWNDLFSSKLDTITEANTFDEQDGTDEHPEPRLFDGEDNLSETGGRSAQHHDKPGGSRRDHRRGRQGKSKRSRGNTRRKEHMSSDGFLEYMDEEERVETELRTAIQTVFHKMFYVPEEARGSEDVLPSEIYVDVCKP